MKGSSNPVVSRSQPVEEGVDALLQQAEDKIMKTYHEVEHSVRRSPAKSLLIAAAAGYVLHRLPVRSIVVANVRILTAVTPPALLMLGAAKLYEFLQQEASNRPR